MRSRMERYQREENKQSARRSNKNQELYQNIGRNMKYTNFTDVTNANAIDLGTAQKNYRTREGYHQIKEYNNSIFWSYDLKNYRKSNWWSKTASTEISDKITIRTANTMKKILEICKK